MYQEFDQLFFVLKVYCFLFNNHFNPHPRNNSTVNNKKYLEVSPMIINGKGFTYKIS